jgi:ribonuclease HI
MQEPRDVAIYTRGIASPGGGAFGALLVCDGRRRELSGGEVGATNNRMDLLAAVESLRALKWPCRVKLYNANGYFIEGMTRGWAQRWQDSGWKTAEGRPTAHSDLWEKLLSLCAEHRVEFIWVPATEDIPEYRRCDQLAREILARQVRRSVEGRGAAEGRGQTLAEGMCADCGRPIPAERRETVPGATRCVRCQTTADVPRDPSDSDEECPRCAARGFRSRLVWRRARDPQISGEFLGCQRYPHCQYIARS